VGGHGRSWIHLPAAVKLDGGGAGWDDGWPAGSRPASKDELPLPQPSVGSTPKAPAAAANGGQLLEARDLRVHFGGVHAVDGVDLTLRQGEILGLIGPNGAGKTTLVNALSGFQRPTGGRVHLNGEDVTGWSPHRLARRGLTRTFQSVRLFPGLTVLENVELGGVGVGLRRCGSRGHFLLVDELTGEDLVGGDFLEGDRQRLAG
jgi:branched-chain amino acid transport system ATP-binding protein